MEIFVDVDQSRCLVHSFTMTELREFDNTQHEVPGSDDVAQSEDPAGLPI
jgi:hypothetical protein